MSVSPLRPPKQRDCTSQGRTPCNDAGRFMVGAKNHGDGYAGYASKKRLKNTIPMFRYE